MVPTTSLPPNALLHGGDIARCQAPIEARRLVHESDVRPISCQAPIGARRLVHESDVRPIKGRS